MGYNLGRVPQHIPLC